MNSFVIDAQLPYRLKKWLTDKGYDVIHTLDLPLKNLTPDTFIADLAIQQNRIVITKDDDFLKLNILYGKPQKLLIITTGNIVNAHLLLLFERNFDFILTLFEKGAMVVEISNNHVFIHQ